MTSLVLAFDTATEALAIALGELTESGVRTVASHDIDAPRAAMSRLLPAVAEMLGSAGVAPDEIAEIAVGRGPGSFTGARIGVATAKGISHGLGVPLYGVGTLDAVSCGFAGYTGLLGVVGDAMRGEVYPALFRVSEGSPERLGEDRVAKPEIVASEWAALGEEILLAGNGLRKYGALFVAVLGQRAILAPEPSWAPTGSGLLAAYADARRRGDLVGGDPGELLPVYTRLSDAEEAERQRMGSPAGRLPESGVDGPEGASGR